MFASCLRPHHRLLLVRRLAVLASSSRRCCGRVSRRARRRSWAPTGPRCRSSTGGPVPRRRPRRRGSCARIAARQWRCRSPTGTRRGRASSWRWGCCRPPIRRTNSGRCSGTPAGRVARVGFRRCSRMRCMLALTSSALTRAASPRARRCSALRPTSRRFGCSAGTSRSRWRRSGASSASPAAPANCARATAVRCSSI